jgi:hypothetical protein
MASHALSTYFTLLVRNQATDSEQSLRHLAICRTAETGVVPATKQLSTCGQAGGNKPPSSPPFKVEHILVWIGGDADFLDTAHNNQDLQQFMGSTNLFQMKVWNNLSCYRRHQTLPLLAARPKCPWGNPVRTEMEQSMLVPWCGQ